MMLRCQSLVPSQNLETTTKVVPLIRPKKPTMDAFPMAFSGCLLLSGGLIALILTAYASLVFSIFIITEVILAFLVALFGMCLLRTSMLKMAESATETEEEKSGRISPFYYELEPIHQKRGLPPIPKDIGREYDPIIMDKV